MFAFLSGTYRRFRYRRRYWAVARLVLAGYWRRLGLRLRREVATRGSAALGPAAKPQVGSGGGRATRVRESMQQLGPVFIKLGQFLSSRPDLLPPDYLRELSRMQDQVPPIDPAKVRRVIQRELGGVPEAVFASFDYRPLASASIAQVHRATLPDGRAAVVKVKRPGLDDLLAGDMVLLGDLSRLAKRTVIGRAVNVGGVYRVLAEQLRRETDFTAEALAMEDFRQVLNAFPGIRVPQVFWGYTTSDVLTMERLPGVRLEMLRANPQQCRELARKVLQAVLAPFFQAGIFHGDPHPGNLLLTPEGIALVDFGNTGRLDPLTRWQVAKLLAAVQEGDVDGVVQVTLNLSEEPFGALKRRELYDDLARVVLQARGLAHENQGLGGLLQGMMKVSLQHHLKLPECLLGLGKAVMQAEGLARRLDPEVDLLAVTVPLAARYLRERVMPPMGNRFYEGLVENLEALGSLPRNVARTLEHLAQGDLTTVFVHRGLEGLYQLLDLASARLSLSLLLVALMGSSALMVNANVPPLVRGVSLIGLVGLAASAGVGLWVAVTLLRHGAWRK